MSNEPYTELSSIHLKGVWTDSARERLLYVIDLYDARQHVYFTES